MKGIDVKTIKGGIGRIPVISSNDMVGIAFKLFNKQDIDPFVSKSNSMLPHYSSYHLCSIEVFHKPNSRYKHLVLTYKNDLKNQ